VSPPRRRPSGRLRRSIQRIRPLRRAQLISPFGVGAITDFRNDEALMCAGLDAWFTAANSTPPDDVRFREERLQQRLAVQYFVRPPEFSEVEGRSRIRVPHVRFPQWHYCPRCFRMAKATLYGDQPRCDNASCSSGRYQRRMIPVRIVAVCEDGHIQDFPFRQWVGCPEKDPAVCELQFKAGRSSASLAGIKIECTRCNRIKTLAGAFERGALAAVGNQCDAARPWLGQEVGAGACAKQLQVVQRGGSNVYFPIVTSSIYIPPPEVESSEDIRRVLDNAANWDAIRSARVNGKVNEAIIRFLAAQQGVDAADLIKAAQAKLDREESGAVPASTEEQYRRQEHDVLKAGLMNPRSELFVEPFDRSRYGWFTPYISHISLVRKLRETRVLAGLSRLMPKSSPGEDGVQPLARARLPWLPAIEVRGEGIFIEFDQNKIEAWSSETAPGLRIQTLVDDYNTRRISRGLGRRNIDPRFIMVQSFAHALIKELTFTCGYGSASLRERLFCNLEDQNLRMNGLLIYTASGDAEGTLGGLVSQAEPGRFERIVASALRRAMWCSNDPVCMESPGGGVHTSNLAACHGCILLPETSCEEGNRLLDRAMLIGTIKDPSIGFFDAAPIT
jgi:Domain of unknown function (DUF1998)